MIFAKQFPSEQFAKIGELMLQVPKASGGDHKSEDFKINPVDNFDKPKSKAIKEAGFSNKQVSQFQQLAKFTHHKQISLRMVMILTN